MVSYRPQFKHKIIKKLQLTVQKVCTHVTSSAASRDNAVKLTTDSYQFWVAHKKPASNFSIAYTVCKKSAKI